MTQPSKRVEEIVDILINLLNQRGARLDLRDREIMITEINQLEAEAVEDEWKKIEREIGSVDATTLRQALTTED